MRNFKSSIVFTFDFEQVLKQCKLVYYLMQQMYEDSNTIENKLVQEPLYAL